MNKIFKVIWSKSKQCYIVVSEVAKNHSGKKKIVVASILAAMAVGGTINVSASTYKWGADAYAAPNAIALGDNTHSGSGGSIALGHNAAAQGTDFTPPGGKKTNDPSIAIGDHASAEGNASVSIGYKAVISQKSYAVAVGREAEVEGDYGVSIGYNTRSAQDGTAVGEQARSKKQGATALGVSSRGYSQGGVAIGWQSLAGANVYTAGVPGPDINKDNETDITNYGKWGDVAIGLRAMATGGNATAVGRSANATEANAIAIGGGDGKASNDNVEHTIASGEKAIAIGYKALASDKNATSIGTDAQARQSRATAIGYEVRAEGKNAVAIGSSGESSAKVVAKGEDAIAIGTRAQGNNIAATAIGKEAVASDTNSIAFGTSAKGVGASSTAIGNSAQATKTNAIALGTEAEASEERAVAIGKGATAEKVDAVALGTSATSGGANGVAIGNDAQAQAADTIAVGSTSRAENVNDSAFGNAAKASGGGSTAIGYIVKTSGNQAFGAGSNSNVSGTAAIGIGYKVTASADRSISIGNDNGNTQTEASGEKAIAIGSGVQSKGSASTAIGKGAIANQENAFAAGTEAKAQATDTVAIGSGVTASGLQSISIGSTFNNITNQATGEASIAIGAAAQSKDDGSIALGRNVQVMDKYTTALGVNITASKKASASTIIGYNSYTKANQSVNIGSTVKTEAGGQYSTAIGYTLSVSGKNAIGIGSSDDGITDDKKLMATGESSIAIGTRAQGKATGATAIGKEAVASHTDAIALGTSAQGTGEASTAIGNGAKATNSHAFAAGVGASAAGNSAIAVGNSASAAKDDSVAIGTSTTASEIETVAVGLRASAQGKRSVSVGIDTESTTADGVSVGYLSKSQALGAVAIGRNAVVTAEKSTAVGYDLSITNSGSTNIGYTSTVKANQAISVGARNLVEAGAGYGTALGYFVNISGKNAIGIGSSDDTKNVIASTKNAIAIGTSAQSHGTSGIALGDNAVVGVAEVKDTNGRVTTAAVDAKHGVAIGTNAKVLAGQGSVALGWSTEVNASDVVNSSTDPGATRVSPYLLDNIGEDNSNDKGNGIVAIGTKRTSGGSGFARRLTGVAGAIGDYDAVNLKQLKALESNEWLLRTQNAGDTNPTDVVPQTVNNQTKKRVTLKAGDNIAISNSNGVVTLNVTNVVKTVTSGDTAALTVNNNNGAVTITPNIASSVGAANEDNKLVTSGKVKTALDAKIDKTAELHIKSGEYTVNSDGIASLIQQNGNNQDQSTGVTIKDIAKKSVVDGINTTVGTHTNQINSLNTAVAGKVSQSDFDTFKVKAITFKGDDDQGVARALDTTLTVKGGANYTSTTTNTNIRVEKDATNGANGLLVKLSDKLSGMKEIAGTGAQDLVIKNGDTKITVKAPANGDKGTVDFGDAKVVASNLDASIKYRANDAAAANAKSVKLADGFNFVASNVTDTAAEGPKSGLAITAGDNGKVTFGLDKATRVKVDNAADKNLSNLSDDGKNKVKELAKTAAQDAVKVADGINTTVTTDTTTTAGVTTYKVNANDTTVAIKGDGLAITGGELGTDKVRKYSLDLSATTKGKLAAVGNLATNVIGGTTIAADGTVTGPTFSITNAEGTAENVGTIKEAIEKLDAANKGQNTKISDTADKVTKLATALGGGTKVENGTFTGPTYNITKADGTGTETASNVGEAISKLDTRITTANGTLVTKGLDFTGNDTTDAGKVHRDLGTTLTIKGAENFTRAATETNNIKVVKNGDALDVKLAGNLANMKEISGDGTSDLVIKNGDTKVTVKAPTSGDKGTVNFGDAKVIVKNLDASIAYKSNQDTAKKTVKLQDGFNFTAATDTAADTNVPKSGLAITTGDNGVVTFGLDKATRSTIDNAADKNLSNLSDTGKTTVKELAKGAAQDAVKVADGINTTVEKDTATAGVTTYKVNANDTTVAVTGDGLAIKGGDLGTDKVRKYSLDLSDTVKAKLNAINNVGDTASNGRDGVNGTSGAKGLTGKDGLNDKTLTDKVNALRNGEAGSVVYTDENGARLVKAKDGQYYKAADVDKDGNVLNNANPATTVEARLVNPKGETTVPTKLSNIADGKVAAGSKDAVNGGQLNTVKSDLATALGGGAKVENGVFTGPTYNITKADGTGTETASNVGEAITKLDTRITTANGTLVTKGLDFTGNDTTAKVHRNLGETLTIKGADNFTRTDTETNNIKVVKNNNDLDVKLAKNLGNIQSISNATGAGKPGSTITLGTDGVSIANTAAGQGGAAGDTKTVTIGKDGINAGGMKVTNVADAEKDGDAANKAYVDNAISNLNTTVTNNANLRYAGDTNEGAATGVDHLNLPLATGTLKVAGTADQIKTVANSGTITLSLDEKVTNKLDKLGDTASNGRDGKDGASGAQGLTGKDGLNDKTLTDKVNALRNGEAGSVVYTDENGARLVKAKDGEYYKAADVDKDGNVLNGATPATTVEARLVNPKGETTVPTTLSNIADGKVAADSKEAVNGGQLNTVKSDLATALGGGAKVENDVFTGPTYNITTADGTGTETASNVGEAISKLDGRINNANTALGNKGLDFYGNKDTADTDKVHRNLGEALKVKGAENFTREANAKNNIDVVKNTAGDGFDVKLAENLGNMKEIAGNGKDDLVIKNGDATITLKPKKDAEGTNPATPATVDFGNTKVVAPNLEASITYRANSAEDADAKTVTLQKGLNFVSGDGTAATAEAAKAGITIAADKDGKVVFGLNEATRNAIDNAADKNLNNLSQAGKDKVVDLAKTAAREAVKVTAGNNVTVTSETKDGNTTYTVNGRDTTVKAADNGSVSVTGGTLNAKGEREYTVDLTAEAKAELGKISDLNTRLGSAEGKITTLQGDMTKAKDDIANNATHIEANKDLIEANKEAIATNKNAIAANTKDIEANTKDIAANRKDIDANTKDIVANRKDIDANKQGIAENKKQIGENTAAIGKNAENIKKNAQDIKKNENAIKSNTDRIQTVENRVTTAEGKIATNEQAIKDNASAIQSNTKAIGANTTAIAKNASDITKANKEIESLKGNSATKDLSNLTNAGKDTITNLINVTGEHGITVTPSTDTTTRVKTFTAKLNDTVTFGSGDKKITVDGTTGTVTSKAVAADTVKANTVHAKTVQLGDSTGTNTTVTADGIAVTTKNPDGTTSKVEIKNGTVSGLTNTKWDPAKVVTEADRSVVATQGQVKDVADTLARGRVFVGDTGNTVTVDLGDTLAIKGGSTKALTDNNIGVVSTEAKDGKPATMTVKLAKDVKMKDGSTSYDYYLPEMKTNPDGSKEIIKNADGSVKHQLGKDGNPIRLVTTTVNGEGITIEPVKGLDKPTVSLTADGLDNGGNQIHNVAAGTLNTDAATVGQVRAAAHALNNRVNEAGAHAAALAAMNPLNYDPLKKSQVMAGVGSYKGNNALALGVAHYANEDTLFNVGIAVGDGSNMVNAGVTYRFGGEDSAVPERYKGGPISSVYVMQDEVSALKAENAEMKAQMKMLMERIEMLAAKA